MLRVTDLSKSYGSQVLFEDVTFSLGKGERTGLVGRNGEGKTTLFKLILGEEHPDSGSIVGPRGYRTGHLGQHLTFSRTSVVEEGCLGLRPEEQDQRWRVESILSGLGFAREDFDRNPSELSGGFHIRLAMTKVLVSRPDLLLLDEPTNYLDIVSVRWLQRFLRAWPDELMIITHDRGFMDSVTTHTLGLHRRRARKVQGGTQKLYDQLLAEEEIHESTRRNVDQQRKHIQSFIDRFRAKASKATLVQSRIRALEKLPELQRLNDIRELDFNFTAAPFPGKTLMELKDVSFGYVPREEAPPLIDGVSLSLEPGDRVAVIGKNGRGKSTFLKIVGGELKPWTGADLRAHPSTKIGYFGQTNIDRLSPGMSVEEEVASVNPTLSRTHVRGLCGVMMFDGEKAEKRIAVLSGGEKSRVLLAKLLAMPSNVLLLDEPTSHLDVESVEALSDSIASYAGAVLIVTHSEGLLRELATKLIVFQAGKVEVFLGTYDEFLERRGWDEEIADGEPSKSVTPDASGPARPAMNPKERRALRSQVMAERTKQVGPLKKRVDALETEIMDLEARIETENHELVEASTAGDGPRITALARSVAQAKVRVDELFAELEDAAVAHDRANAEFEERLKALE